MRRRLLKLAVVSLVVPMASRAADEMAQRLESANGRSSTTKALRQVASAGRRFSGRR